MPYAEKWPSWISEGSIIYQSIKSDWNKPGKDNIPQNVCLFCLIYMPKAWFYYYMESTQS